MVPSKAILGANCCSLVLLVVLLVFTVGAAAQVTPLEQGWKFLPDSNGELSSSEVINAPGWRDVRVGLSWNAQFDDLRDYAGVAWYRTTVEVPQFVEPGHVLLRFGAVDYFCEVFLNGKSVGTHEGGYTPFTLDVTRSTRPGWNQMLVRVVDPPMDPKENRARFPEWIYDEIPHGKQNWYVQTSGIWQPVLLEFRPALYIESVHVTTHVDGQVQADVRVGGSQNMSSHALPLTVMIRDETGRTQFTETVTVEGPGAKGFQGRIDSPRLWSPDHPVLYSIEARLGDASVDVLRDRFGFRSFEARDGKLFLNGEPFYMRSALDQDFYPETIYTPPSKQYMRDMMIEGKRLGLNLLRCHIKVPDPAYLEAADEVGMLVWYEIPSWNDAHHFTSKAAERGEKTFAEMVERDWNHPSIVIQSIINESWGADLKQVEQRRWLRAAFERAKQLTAPLGRLIDDNSACCDNFHVKSDLDDFHQYFSIPDSADRWDKWTAEFATRPKWSFSPFGDAERSGKEPLILSEFGNWGLPKPPKIWPWWYGRDFGGREVTRPAGVLERFRQYHLDSLFGQFDTLAEESQWHQYASLKHEIEEIRGHASIQGYVITEFTDINWEVNGLMDMWRRPKVYAKELAHIQQPDVLLAKPSKYNFYGGDVARLEGQISHYGSSELKGARLAWWTESGAAGHSELQDSVAPTTIKSLEAFSFTIPIVMKPRSERVWMELRSRDGELLAENSYEIFVYPKPQPAANVEVTLDDPDGRLKNLAPALKQAGYTVLSDPSGNASALMIATKYDSRVENLVQQGGRVLLLCDSADGLPANGSLKLVPRAGSDLDGNWVTNFNWVRQNAAPFEGVALNRLVGVESTSVVPEYIIDGVNAENYDDVLSGIFYGWLNRNAALAVQASMRKGKVFLTTFRFADYGKDPYATLLFDSLIRYTSASAFAPKLTITLKGGTP
ncbi:MAG TPA: glycoside hydrolase family 2 TIM barrel-domain containing protein [Candidatus Dormibacteraeota bacterium]|nr:glycoside hydrolase family 2 TIM barrel-domain containing protein [Candidatus Dormibacteraeota bacterium]